MRQKYVDIVDLVPVLADDKSNIGLFFASGAPLKDFEMNFGGHPRNDIALINAQEELAVAESLIRKLSVLPSSGVTDSSLSDSDVIEMSFKSKYCQTPAEYVRTVESKVEAQFGRDVAAARASGDEETAKRKSARLSALKDSLTSVERDALNAEKRKREIEELIDNV